MTATTRRAALGALASAPALALPAVAMAAVLPSGDDAELISLAAEIERLRTLGKEIYAERAAPFDETFQNIFRNATGSDDERLAAAFAYSREIGRDAAIEEQAEIDEQADRLWKRMMAIPAATQAGRAAKVGALLVHVCTKHWRGPADDLDWDKRQTRALLGQFAGMTEEELAAI
jgi:hypothetical protein